MPLSHVPSLMERGKLKAMQGSCGVWRFWRLSVGGSWKCKLAARWAGLKTRGFENQVSGRKEGYGKSHSAPACSAPAILHSTVSCSTAARSLLLSTLSMLPSEAAMHPSEIEMVTTNPGFVYYTYKCMVDPGPEK